jgi:hypothetical protein
MGRAGSVLTRLDTDYTIRQVLHTEGDLAGWSARDIHELGGPAQAPDLVVLGLVQLVQVVQVVLVLGPGEAARLGRSLARGTGLLGYLAAYWAGFYPLLVVHLQTEGGAPLDPRTVSRPSCRTPRPRRPPCRRASPPATCWSSPPGPRPPASPPPSCSQRRPGSTAMSASSAARGGALGWAMMDLP